MRRGYDQLARPNSGCLRFVWNESIQGPLLASFQELSDSAIDCVYLDYSRVPAADYQIVRALAELLHLDNAPYGPNAWLEFVDDLITFAHRANGLVVIVDNAHLLLKHDGKQMFELIETFLIQIHHWLEHKKPCYLCFQMESNASLGLLFEGGRLLRSVT